MNDIGDRSLVIELGLRGRKAYQVKVQGGESVFASTQAVTVWIPASDRFCVNNKSIGLPGCICLLFWNHKLLKRPVVRWF